MSEKLNTEFNIIQIFENGNGVPNLSYEIHPTGNINTKDYVDGFDLIESNNQNENQMKQLEPVRVVGGEHSIDAWTNEETIALLELRKLHHRNLEYGLPGTKRIIWQEIAKAMTSKGFKKDSKSCDEKWRRLKLTYSRVKFRMEATRKPVKWSFFKMMDQILQKEAHSHNHDRNTVATTSLIKTTNYENNESVFCEEFNPDTDIHDHLYHKTSEIIPELDGAVILEENISSFDDKINEEEGWTPSAIYLLLSLRKKLNEKFIHAKKGGKTKIWVTIAAEMQAAGFRVGAEDCNSKWRRMKTRFKNLKVRCSANPDTLVKWCYFKQMEDILGKNFPFLECSKVNNQPSPTKNRQINKVHSTRSDDFQNGLLNQNKEECAEEDYQDLSGGRTSLVNGLLKPDGVHETTIMRGNNPFDIFAASLISELLHKKKSVINIAKEQTKNFEERLTRLEEAEHRYSKREQEGNERQRRLICALEESNRLEERKIRAFETYLKIINKKED